MKIRITEKYPASRKLQITAQASQPLNIQQPKYSVDKECLERMLQPIKLEI
jgi:hypothetical protein